MAMLKLFFCFLISTILIGAQPSEACSVCFGDPKSLTMQGVRFGILFLLFMVIFVLSLFARFFMKFQERAKRIELGSH